MTQQSPVGAKATQLAAQRVLVAWICLRRLGKGKGSWYHFKMFRNPKERLLSRSTSESQKDLWVSFCIYCFGLPAPPHPRPCGGASGAVGGFLVIAFAWTRSCGCALDIFTSDLWRTRASCSGAIGQGPDSFISWNKYSKKTLRLKRNFPPEILLWRKCCYRLRGKND